MNYIASELVRKEAKEIEQLSQRMRRSMLLEYLCEKFIEFAHTQV